MANFFNTGFIKVTVFSVAVAVLAFLQGINPILTIAAVLMGYVGIVSVSKKSSLSKLKYMNFEI